MHKIDHYSMSVTLVAYLYLLWELSNFWSNLEKIFKIEQTLKFFRGGVKGSNQVHALEN